MQDRMRVFTLVVLGMLSLTGFTQNRIEAQKHIAVLSSDTFYGRGYINDGDKIAAQYLGQEFERIGLKPVAKKYLHPISLTVNTINNVELTIGEELFTEGSSFMLNPNAQSSQIRAELKDLSNITRAGKQYRKAKKCYKKGHVPVLDKQKLSKEAAEKIKKLKEQKATTTLWLDKNPIYSVGRNQTDDLEIYLKEELWESSYKNLTIKVDANLKKDYITNNVIGKIEGTEVPDSVIVLCGHYDHLGMLGDAIFYGANDNASGIAMLLSLAKYFAENPQRYSIVFIGFGAEEAGLIGSYQFVSNPPKGFDLAKTKFVFNMDLMGSGEDGATIVNATLFKDYFDMLNTINTSNEYLKVIKKRGKAANSDHYFFSEAGIPSFFMYTMGAYKHYHNTEDNADNLKLSEYFDKSFFLIRDFVIDLNR
jgi:aminopeptidase YwaD